MNFIKSLDDKVWMTAKARYNASARLNKKHQALTFTISFLSVAQIVLTFCMLVDICFGFPEKVLMFIAMTTSVMILVIANQSALGSLLIESEKLHRFGIKFQSLYEEISLYIKLDKANKSVEEGFQQRYSQLLREADINHLKIDEELVKAERKSFELNPICALWIKFKNLVAIYLSSFLYLAIPLGLLWGASWLK
ncbi:SLATT domain-containing protein [Maridesulfovibrio bastinii]|uniref:SLATT domain-containing protein n=1 Tax=Maridesulfovibrio bastinii TaxID=47157 RepID=UPI00047F6C1F|nr:SLATT domain-containing protein [Maridesulfovibrio bastinii]